MKKTHYQGFIRNTYKTNKPRPLYTVPNDNKMTSFVEGSTEVQLNLPYICVDAIHVLNEVHGDFLGIFFHGFRKLLQKSDNDYGYNLADYVRLMRRQYMFVRVERPYGSKRFVMGYVKCDQVFSFVPRYEQMIQRLNRVPARVLGWIEAEHDRELRVEIVGMTNYEKVLEHYHYYGLLGMKYILNAAIIASDEMSTNILLDSGLHNPNTDNFHFYPRGFGVGMNALHIAARRGCSIILFEKILSMIENVNATDGEGKTALMLATKSGHLDIVISLMNHPEIDLNFRWAYDNSTALHLAIFYDQYDIVVQLLSDVRVDTSLKDNENLTPFELALENRLIGEETNKIIELLRKHGAK